MALSKDEGIGDTGGNNEENMRIERLDDMKFCLDILLGLRHGAKRTSRTFKNSDVTLTITDDAGHQNTVTIDTGDSGNVCCIATIDKSDPAQAKFINYSQVGTLNGLKTLEQLTGIVQQFVI
jgi:hypothetical protein